MRTQINKKDGFKLPRKVINCSFLAVVGVVTNNFTPFMRLWSIKRNGDKEVVGDNTNNGRR
jgi:hypothetical protein